jgi:hypothetical protein
VAAFYARSCDHQMGRDDPRYAGQFQFDGVVPMPPQYDLLGPSLMGFGRANVPPGEAQLRRACGRAGRGGALHNLTNR